ncbi:predicted protein, partial [Nematostella vectensis]
LTSFHVLHYIPKGPPYFISRVVLHTQRPTLLHFTVLHYIPKGPPYFISRVVLHTQRPTLLHFTGCITYPKAHLTSFHVLYY